MLGSETPRIFTPPLRELTPETSLGFECAEFAEAVGVHLFPWEQWFLIHALELNEDGTLRFRTVILLVARQNGKTTLLKILALYWMVVLGRLLVIGTAQNLDIAEETWEDTVNLAQSSPEIEPLIAADGIKRQVGKKSLIFETGERYKVKAANRRAGRGLSGDLVQMDELREHTTWEAWAAVSSTIMAIDDALVLGASNAGDLSSIVLRQLRFMCMCDPLTVGVTQSELESFGELPDAEDQPEDLSTDTVGFFEWSAKPGRGIWDREGWAEGNPSLGYTITESAMATQARIAAAGGDAEWMYRTENLCQWRPVGSSCVFPDGTWDKGIDEESFIPEQEELFVCVDVSWNRTITNVVVAGRRADHRVHVEVVARAAGTDWVLDWLTSDDRPAWAGVTVQATGAPASSLVEKMQLVGLPVTPWSGPDIGKAHGEFYDLVVKDQLRHRSQPALDVAATTAVTRPIGDGVWAFDRRRSPRDCSPLLAAVGAVWQMRPQVDESKKPMIHAWPEDLVREMESWR